MSVGWTVAGVLGVGAAGLFSYGAFLPRSRLFGPVVSRGAEGCGARVALTFDDGPDPEATPAILDALGERGVRAAFFVIGRHAERYPELLRRIDAEGHLIGNHTLDHDYHGLFRFPWYWHRQLAATERIVAEAVGKRPRLFRPPMGFKHMFLMRVARRLDVDVVTWTRRAYDGWGAGERRIVERLGERSRAGEILMLHDGSDGRARPNLAGVVGAIGPVVDGLRERGLGFARLDELIDRPGYRGEESAF